MPFCPQCSQSVGTDDKFCSQCGRDLTAGLSAGAGRSTGSGTPAPDADAKRRRITLIIVAVVIIDALGALLFLLLRA